MVSVMSVLPAAERNPFEAQDPDRADIWTMLVQRDIDAFVAADWDAVKNDFVVDGFFGVDGGKKPNPDTWSMRFPGIGEYRDEWLRQAKEFRNAEFAEDPRAAIFRATRLEEIEISGDRAIAHKKFDGSIRKADGTLDRLLWQTLYFCKKTDAGWKITSFCGYLPNPLGGGTHGDGQTE